MAGRPPPGRCGPARRWPPLASQSLPGGTSGVSGDDAGGVPIQAAAGAVVSHGGPGIGVRGGFLDVAERHPGVQGGGDERVPQRVGADRFGDPGAAGGSQVVNSAGHGGPGDVVALVFNVRTPGGAEAGKAYASCTFVRGPGPVALCHVAFVLKGGQIDAQGPITFGPAPRFTAAVTGGTGIYNGVTGQNRNVGTPSGVIDQTFFLIHPDHD